MWSDRQAGKPKNNRVFQYSYFCNGFLILMIGLMLDRLLQTFHKGAFVMYDISMMTLATAFLQDSDPYYTLLLYSIVYTCILTYLQ